MREYPLHFFLVVLITLSLFVDACDAISWIMPPTTSPGISASSLAPDVTPELIPKSPAPAIETAPGIAAGDYQTPDNNEIGNSSELTTEPALSSNLTAEQTITEVAADEELSTSSDNKTTASTIPAPDLVIQDITWSPANPSLRDKVDFTIIVRNQGSVKADSSRINFYIDDTLITTASVSPVDPDATAQIAVTWIAEVGTHAVKAVTNPNNVVAESDETNNSKAFVLSTLGPDLIIQDITWSPESPSIRENVTFTVTLKNQGNRRAVSSRVNFYIDDKFRGYQDIPRMEADAIITKTFSWTTQAGTHDIKAAADGFSQVAEIDETNNEKTVMYSTPAPDLIIQDITWSPVIPSEGSTVTFTVIIENQGSGKSDYSHVAYYIDNKYQTSVNVNQINPGTTVTKTFSWTMEVGSHDFRAVADFYKRIAENDESNNETTAAFSTTFPDFIVQNITWLPASPAIGATITFSITVKNQGGSTADASHIDFSIDDLSIGYNTIQEMAAGATVTNTFTWTAPTGSHTIKAVADPQNVVRESDETNNIKAVTFSGPALSDLVVQNVTWSPETPSMGDTVTFTVTIKNQGAGSADYSYVACYIDNVYLTASPTHQVAPGAVTTSTLTWTAQAGSHDIKVVTDIHKLVTESNEVNNEMTVTLSPLAPDLIVQDISWSPANPANGDTVTFTVTIKNQGGYDAGYSLVRYYIDDSFTGYQDVPGIGIGATATKTFTWIAEAGTHNIKVLADIEKRVTESLENNNEKIVSFSVSPY